MTGPAGRLSRNAVFILIAEGDTTPSEPCEPSEPFEPGRGEAAALLTKNLYLFIEKHYHTF